MKTKLLFMLLLCSFYCVSCSNDVKTDAKENAVVEANYAKLNETLDLYSQNFVASHPTSVATRGRFWNWFKAVLFCDASGAALVSCFLHVLDHVLMLFLVRRYLTKWKWL